MLTAVLSQLPQGHGELYPWYNAAIWFHYHVNFKTLYVKQTPGPVNNADDTHKLGPVEEAADEAKKRLQPRSDSLKRRQKEVGDEMNKYKELLRQLETEYNNTLEKMRRHKKKQVRESCLSLPWMCNSSSAMGCDSWSL